MYINSYKQKAQTRLHIYIYTHIKI
jgi:hypothetical protein